MINNQLPKQRSTGSTLKAGSTVEKGFTLVETVIAMVLMGVAMITLTTLLYPYFYKSAEYQAQVRAAALAQSMLDVMLGESFDENSDQSGNRNRCDDEATNPCGSHLGIENNETPSTFNDIDDFYGCWYADVAGKQNCTSLGYAENNTYSFTTLFGSESSEQYKGFNVSTMVTYSADFDPNYLPAYDSNNLKQLKWVRVDVSALNSDFKFQITALKGNY